MESTFRGFESENQRLSDAREREQTFGYRLADLCTVYHDGTGAHVRREDCPEPK